MIKSPTSDEQTGSSYSSADEEMDATKQAWKEQTSSMIRQLIWLLDYRYNQSLSDDFIEKAFNFYYRALSKTNGLQGRPPQTKNHHEPLNNLHVLNIFAQLEAKYHDDIERLPYAQKEMRYYEWFLIATIINQKTYFDPAIWINDYLDCIDLSYFQTHLNKLPKEVTANENARWLRPSRLIQSAKAKYDLNEFETSVLTYMVALDCKLDLSRFVSQIEFCSLHDYWGFIAVYPENHRQNVLTPPQDMDQNLRESIESNCTDPDSYATIRTIERRKILNDIQLFEEQLSRPLAPEDMDRLKKEMTVIENKLELLKYGMSEQELAFFMIHTAKQIQGRKKIKERRNIADPNSVVTSRLHEAYAFLKQKKLSAKDKPKPEDRCLARLKEVERSSLIDLEWHTSVLLDEDALKAIEADTLQLYQDRAIIDPTSENFIGNLDIPRDQQKAILTGYHMKAAQTVISIQQLCRKPNSAEVMNEDESGSTTYSKNKNKD